jgi:hypothetical protein
MNRAGLIAGTECLLFGTGTKADGGTRWGPRELT